MRGLKTSVSGYLGFLIHTKVTSVPFYIIIDELASLTCQNSKLLSEELES